MQTEKLNKMIEGCKNQRNKSQKALFEAFYGKAMGICMRYIKDEDAAKDVVQDSFIKLFNKIDTYDSTGSFEGWLKKIFVNGSLDHIRSQKSRKTYPLEFSENIEDEDALDFEYEKIPTIPVDKILTAIKKLPVGYRTIFNLYAVEGYSHKEVAGILEIHEGTSKSSYHKAKRILAEELSLIKNLN